MNKIILKPTIISFSAQARHGKDSSCIILKEKLEALGQKPLIISYANYLKYIVAQYFGGSYEKNPENRTLWQKFGTELVRERNPNFWVDTVIDFTKVFGQDFTHILIADTRFPNEILRWKEEGYKVFSIHVKRLNFKNDLTEEQKKHPSETALNDYKFDYYIESENGLDNLEKEIDKMINVVCNIKDLIIGDTVKITQIIDPLDADHLTKFIGFTGTVWAYIKKSGVYKYKVLFEDKDENRETHYFFREELELIKKFEG